MFSLSALMELASGKFPFPNLMKLVTEAETSLAIIEREQAKLHRINYAVRYAVKNMRDLTEEEVSRTILPGPTPEATVSPASTPEPMSQRVAGGSR
jgi:hypothetical protein